MHSHINKYFWWKDSNTTNWVVMAWLVNVSAENPSILSHLSDVVAHACMLWVKDFCPRCNLFYKYQIKLSFLKGVLSFNFSISILFTDLPIALPLNCRTSPHLNSKSLMAPISADVINELVLELVPRNVSLYAPIPFVHQVWFIFQAFRFYTSDLLLQM